MRRPIKARSDSEMITVAKWDMTKVLRCFDILIINNSNDSNGPNIVDLPNMVIARFEICMCPRFCFWLSLRAFRSHFWKTAIAV
jgi:hypothetical protein